jgi:hypothetical protein
VSPLKAPRSPVIMPAGQERGKERRERDREGRRDREERRGKERREREEERRR